MSISQINIHSVNARLEFESTRPTIDMRQQQAQIQIESELPKITIDQSECFNTSGLKNNTAFIDAEVGRAKQNILQYTETTVTDGQMFAAIENPGDASDVVGQIATRNMLQEHEFNVVSMPSAKPKIGVVEGSLNIDFLPRNLGVMNGVQYYANFGKLTGHYTPASISVDYRI